MGSRFPRLLVLILAAAMLVGTGAGCARQATPPESKPAPVTITYATHVDPMVDWDPAKSWAAEIIALQNIYETLVRIDPLENNKFIPVLATGWKESPDHLRWTFELRKGVKFHSGKVLTADVAARSIKRTIDMKKGAAYLWDGVKEIKALDETTLEFTLSRPLPMLLIASSAYAAYIYDPEYDTDWYVKPNADGTGPYKLASYKKDSEVILEKFADYWGGWDKEKAQFDFAIIKVVPESATRRQMLTSGEADIVQQLPVEDIQALKSDKNIAVSETTSFQQLYAFLNTQKPPLDNKYIRQAMAYLFPYDDVINYVMGGTAVQARGVIPPTLWGYGPDLFQYKYDPVKAKELLAKGGKPNGGFKLLYTYTSGNKDWQKIGELYKDSLAKVNITLETRAMTVDARYNLARAPNAKDRQDITMLYWWPDNVDPSGYLFSQFHAEKTVGFNFGYYSNPTVDKLIDEGMVLAGSSIAEATKKFIAAQEIIIDECPAIFAYCENYLRAYRANLKGYEDNPAYPNVVYFRDVYRAK